MKNLHKISFLALLPLLHGCEVLQIADQSLYALTETVSQKDTITGQRTLSLQNRNQQIQKGNEVAEQIIAEEKASGKRFNEAYSPKAYARIQRIFSRLHEVSHVRGEKWTAVLIEDKGWNAFTTGGTYFVINSALEADLKDDAELANVIAHEMAHAVANHAFESRSYAQLSSLTKSKTASRETFQAAFTHENEAEADRIGILYCALAGFDPFAGSRLWKKQYAQKGNNALFVHDHPMNAERAVQAENIAKLVSKYYIQNQKNFDFESILSDNEVFANKSTSQTEVIAGQGGGFLAALDTALTTVEKHQNAKIEEQRQQSRILFMRSIHAVSEIVGSEPIAPNQWRMTVKYKGNRPLTNLGFKLIVQRANAEPLELTKQLSGVLQPNMTFYVDFESSELDAYRTNPKNIGFIYDDAISI